MSDVAVQILLPYLLLGWVFAWIYLSGVRPGWIEGSVASTVIVLLWPFVVFFLCLMLAMTFWDWAASWFTERY